MRPLEPHELRNGAALVAQGVSISKADLENGSPKPGDMIARNPKNSNDLWLVAAEYFEDNLELAVTAKSVEEEILDKGLTAPRVTPAQLVSVIAKTEFHKLTGVLTVCVITLKNGFTVTGESACASPENYNQEIGERIAEENAQDKIWPLEGYLLKQQLFEQGE